MRVYKVYDFGFHIATNFKKLLLLNFSAVQKNINNYLKRLLKHSFSPTAYLCDGYPFCGLKE